MYKLTGTFLALLPFVTLVAAADSPVWGQCGGIGWTGPTTCASGTFCNKQNDWYSQCIPGTGGGGGTTTSIPTPTSTNSGPTSTSTASGLNNIAKAHGKLYFGSAVDNSELSDQTFTNLLSNTNEFGQITPGNSMKWDATEPSRNSFSFSGGDVIANLAKKNGQLLRAHALLWHNQLPNWVTSRSWTKDELTSVIQNHIAGVAGHYKGIPYAWDVVNEPVEDDGTWRQSVFYKTFGGTGFIDVAFKAARQADPNAKLYINEYNLEYAGAKFNTMYGLVKQLVANGVPIDGVGFQAHMIVGSMPTDIGTRLKAFTDLGLEVAFTELDIRMDLPVTQDKLQQQKKDYQTIVSACAQLPKCVGVTTWGYTDKHSWIPGTFPGTGAGLVWDENYNKKPAYDGIVAAFSS